MKNKIKQFFSRFREETELIKECNRKTPLHRKLGVLASIFCILLMIFSSCLGIFASADDSGSVPDTDSGFELTGSFIGQDAHFWNEVLSVNNGYVIYFLSSVDNLEGNIISVEFSYNGSLYYGIGCFPSSFIPPSGSLHAFNCVSSTTDPVVIYPVVPLPYTLEFDSSLVSIDFLNFLCRNFEPAAPDSYNPDKPNFQLVYSDGFNYGFMLGSASVDGDGYDSGYSAGYNKGLTQGTSEGYDLGYSEGLTQGTNEGYDLGYNSGLRSGYNDGFEDGRLDGYELGYSQGCSDTEPIAYESGRLVGYSSGLEEGYANGYADGVASSNDSSGDGSDGSADSFDYESVYEDGYTQGYSDGRNSEVSNDFGNFLGFSFEKVLEGLKQFVFYEYYDPVLGSRKVTLWSLLGTIIIVSITLWIIKFIGS